MVNTSLLTSRDFRGNELTRDLHCPYCTACHFVHRIQVQRRGKRESKRSQENPEMGKRTFSAVCCVYYLKLAGSGCSGMGGAEETFWGV